MTTVRQKMLRTEDFPPEQRSWIEPLLRYCNDLNTDTSSILNGGLRLSQSGAAFFATATVQTLDDWIAYSLLNSWVAFDVARTPKYRKYSGTIQSRGIIKSGTMATVFATLPAAYRSALAGVALPVVSNDAFGEWDVNGTTGDCIANVGNNAWFSVEGQFAAADTRSAPNAAFPLTIKNQLKGEARPNGIVIVQAIDVTVASSPAPISVGGAPAWAMKGNDISIVDVAGLGALRKYKLTFLVLG